MARKPGTYYDLNRERQLARANERNRGKATNETPPKPAECEVCGEQDVLLWDHDHKTGKFRGWVCRKCNLALSVYDRGGFALFGQVEYYINRVPPGQMDLFSSEMLHKIPK